MSTQPKKKLCWNCEGSTSFEDEHCPYCGVYLSPLSIGDSKGKESLYAPPYRFSNYSEEQNTPPSPYLVKENSKSEKPVPHPIVPERTAPIQEEAISENSKNDLKGIVMPIGLLLSGSVFFIFGLILLLFSKDGVFTLQWNGALWFLYWIIGLPLFAFGWRSIQQLEE